MMQQLLSRLLLTCLFLIVGQTLGAPIAYCVTPGRCHFEERFRTNQPIMCGWVGYMSQRINREVPTIYRILNHFYLRIHPQRPALAYRMDLQFRGSTSHFVRLEPGIVAKLPMSVWKGNPNHEKLEEEFTKAISFEKLILERLGKHPSIVPCVSLINYT